MNHRSHSLSLGRDAVAVAIVAVLTFQGLRNGYGDRYLVPTGSMEPVLHGDPRDGDVVFVDKTAGAGSLRRHDLVVVRHPEAPDQPLVKRIAACGDEPASRWIDVRQGDVWLGDSPQRLQREQKDPLASRAQRVPWADTSVPASSSLLDLRAARVVGDEWHLPPVAAVADEVRSAFRPEARRRRRLALDGPRLPEGCIGTARAVDAGCLTANGQRLAVGADHGVFDCGLELELADASTELLATIDARIEALTFHWQPAQQRVVLWRNGENVAERTLAVPAGQRIEFGRLDDRVWFAVGDDPAGLFVVPRAADWNNTDENGMPGGPRTAVHLAAIGGAGASLRLRRLRVFHDVFAWRDPIVGLPGQPGTWPREVPPGHWFLLGDSAFDSRDSRQFGAVPESSLLGVPTRVLGPWARRRSLRS